MSDFAANNMTRLTTLVRVINGWSGAALTQYGQERVELGGPVVSRWLSKIANYLTNELATDLFSSDEPTPTRIYTSLQPWQDVLLADHSACDGMGAPRHATAPAGRPFCDKFSGAGGTRRAGGRAPTCSPSPAPTYPSPGTRGSTGPWTHWPRSPWRPTRSSSTPPSSWPARGTRPWLGCAPRRGSPGRASRSCGRGAPGQGRCSTSGCRDAAWLLIDPHVVSPERLPQILATEAADAGLVTYAR